MRGPAVSASSNLGRNVPISNLASSKWPVMDPSIPSYRCLQSVSQVALCRSQDVHW